VGRNHQPVRGIADGDGVLYPEKLLQALLKLNDQWAGKALRGVIPPRKNASRRFLVSFPLRPVKLTNRQQLVESWICAKNGKRWLAGHSVFLRAFSSEPRRLI